MVDCSVQYPIQTEVVKPLNSAVPWLVLKTKTSSSCVYKQLSVSNTHTSGYVVRTTLASLSNNVHIHVVDCNVHCATWTEGVETTVYMYLRVPSHCPLMFSIQWLLLT